MCLKNRMRFAVAVALLVPCLAQLLLHDGPLYRGWFISAGACLTAFIFIAWLLERSLLGPIARLKRVAAAVNRGNYAAAADFSGDGILEDVGQALEGMAEVIARREKALNRQRGLYALLSHSNRSTLCDVEPQRLFARFCEIAVTHGGFAAAWAGEVDRANGEVRPLAHAGAQGAVFCATPLPLDKESPLGVVALGGCPVIIDEFGRDGNDLPWKPCDAGGVGAAVVLPIPCRGGVDALLVLYADDPQSFDGPMVGLLTELMGDLALALENHARRRAHVAAHKALKASGARLSEINRQMCLLLQSTGEGIFGVDPEGRCCFINQAAASMLGYRREQLLRQPLHELIRVRSRNARSFCEGMECKSVPRRVRDESFRRRDNTRFPVEYATHPILEAGRLRGSVTVFRDVTESRSMQRELRFLANHDPLTHLLNRHAFHQRLRDAVADARDHGLAHVLFYMDLDRFKVMNDTCGHVAGDRLLRRLSRHLRQAIGAQGVLARLGGDEFGLLLERRGLEEGLQVAADIFGTVRHFRFAWEGRTFSCGMSIGIVAIDAAMADPHLALSAADTACYVAKEMGRNRVHVYTPHDEEISRQRLQMQWVNRIEAAFQQDRFRLVQQPILSLAGRAGGDEHVEVLLRMLDEQGNEIAPGAFIPAAERYNLMGGVDRWVVRHTFAWLSGNRRRLDELGLCAINLSGQSLGDGSLTEFILEQLRIHELPAEKIAFEITETAVVSRLDQASRFISLLKRRGFRFALDDFGSGMSSFAYLKSLPVDYLKIDGGFVRNMLNDPVDRAVVESINRIGHLMGLKTVAEYVESDQILEQLMELGVDYAQGFGVVRPFPAEASDIRCGWGGVSPSRRCSEA